MTGDNQANYTKIGFFIVLGITLIIGTLAYVGGVGAGQHEFLAETFFQNAVSGLDVGAAVNFRGVRIGSVRRISFVGAEYDDEKGSITREDARKIYVLLAIDTRLFRLGRSSGNTPANVMRKLVERGLHATVSASGLTGLSRIELNFPNHAVDEQTPSWTPKYVCIPPAASLFQSVADSATAILSQINKIDIVSAWTNIVNATSSANEFLGSLNAIVNAQQGTVSGIMEDLRETSKNFREISSEIRADPSSLLRPNPPAPLEEMR